LGLEEALIGFVFAGVAAAFAQAGEELLVLAITFLLQVFERDEAKGGRVEAVAQAGGLGAVVEEVAQVRAAVERTHLGALHAGGVVGVRGDIVGLKGWKNDGQPVRESYLSSEEKSGSPEATST
jgi:hypothetical protein